MNQLLIVGCGGFLGSVGRYLLGSWIMSRASLSVLFPFGTFAVNALGCFLAGCFLALYDLSLSPVKEDARLFVLTGFLGGFTTLSAFGVETFSLLRKGEWQLAGAYALLTFVIALLATMLAYFVCRRLA